MVTAIKTPPRIICGSDKDSMLLFWEPDSRLRLLPGDGVDPGYFVFREPQHRDYHQLSKSGDKDMVTAQHHSDSLPVILTTRHGTIHSSVMGQITHRMNHRMRRLLHLGGGCSAGEPGQRRNAVMPLSKLILTGSLSHAHKPEQMGWSWKHVTQGILKPAATTARLLTPQTQDVVS